MTIETRYGKLTGNKEVLNVISLYLGYARDCLDEKGRKSMALEAKEIASAIYGALKEVEYYK